MTQNDLKQIDALFDKRFKTQDQKFEALLDRRFKTQDQKFEALLDRRFKTQDQKFEALLDRRFTESENRFDKKLEDLEGRLNSKIESSAEEVVNGFADILNESVFPELSKTAKKSDIERLERRLDAVSDKVGDHDVRIKAIEQIPAVAHELKRSKKK